MDSGSKTDGNDSCQSHLIALSLSLLPRTTWLEDANRLGVAASLEDEVTQ